MNAYNQIQNPYPPLKDVPDELINLAGPCGPISVWLVLQRHGIYVPPNEIINRCRYTEDGCFLVCMADALRQFELDVSFHSDTDLDINQVELESYTRILPSPPLSLAKLLNAVNEGASVIVSYLAYGGEGHFSPLAGSKANKLLLPYSIEGEMLKSEFNKRWRSNGILRQSIIVS